MTVMLELCTVSAVMTSTGLIFLAADNFITFVLENVFVYCVFVLTVVNLRGALTKTQYNRKVE